MTILSRYILREALRIFLMAFSGLMTIYLVVDFFEKTRKFSDHDPRFVDVAVYFLFRTPEIAFQMAPLAVLLATLLSLGTLSRNREITAMRSCGMSLFRVALPLLGFAAMVTWALFIVSAVVMPLSMARAELIRLVNIEQRNPSVSLKTNGIWLQIEQGKFLQIEAVDTGGRTLRGIRLYEVGPEFRLTKLVEGEAVHYTDEGWILQAGFERRLYPDGRTATTRFEHRPLDLAQIPEDFSTWLSVESKHMTLFDLRAYADRLARDGYSFSHLLTDYYDRMAFSFVSLVMALIGIALSLRLTGVRGGGMAVGIGQALGVAFLYWMTRSVAVALGHSGVLLPILAGWFANLIFFSFGFYLLLRVRY